ncbi:hypothetical protein ACJX0J_033634, partial [Zea mays]
LWFRMKNLSPLGDHMVSMLKLAFISIIVISMQALVENAIMELIAVVGDRLPSQSRKLVGSGVSLWGLHLVWFWGFAVIFRFSSHIILWGNSSCPGHKAQLLEEKILKAPSMNVRDIPYAIFGYNRMLDYRICKMLLGLLIAAPEIAQDQVSDVLEDNPTLPENLLTCALLALMEPCQVSLDVLRKIALCVNPHLDGVLPFGWLDPLLQRLDWKERWQGIPLIMFENFWIKLDGFHVILIMLTQFFHAHAIIYPRRNFIMAIMDSNGSSQIYIWENHLDLMALSGPISFMQHLSLGTTPTSWKITNGQFGILIATKKKLSLIQAQNDWRDIVKLLDGYKGLTKSIFILDHIQENDILQLSFSEETCNKSKTPRKKRIPDMPISFISTNFVDRANGNSDIAVEINAIFRIIIDLRNLFSIWFATIFEYSYDNGRAMSERLRF